MEGEVKRFYIKKSYYKIIFSLIYLVSWVSLFILNWIGSNKNRTIIDSVCSVLFYVCVIVFAIYNTVKVFETFCMRENGIPSILIENEKIEIPYKYFFKSKSKLIHVKDIMDLYIPKWDEYIEITMTDSKKERIYLLEYADEDKIKLREIFMGFKGRIN